MDVFVAEPDVSQTAYILTPEQEFTAFFPEAERRLRAALIASWGREIGSEAAADALAWAWQYWPRVRSMRNPYGYLYRVGQTAARRARPSPSVRSAGDVDSAEVEPRLKSGLAAMTNRQRTVVLLVIGDQWTQQEVADLLGISHSSVRTHLRRGLEFLQDWIGEAK